MIATIALAALVPQQGQTVKTVNNGKETTPVAAYQQVQEVAKMLGTTLYVPDKSLKGYGLRIIDVATVPANTSFPGLKERSAVRLCFLNRATMSSLEIIQIPSDDKTNSTNHTKWVFNGKFFDTGLVQGHSFVAGKRGTMDVALQGGLISEPSAKIVLEKLVAISPQ